MAVDAYLQIDGIKGESADSNHIGWIEITSASWGVKQPRSATASTAGGHTAERCEHKSISLHKLADDGPKNEHASHRDGLQVDVRAVRKDGLQLPVTWQDHEYDQEATGKLIDIFFSHPLVKKILFNDTRAHSRVMMWPHHDNHFHVEIR